MPRKFKSTERFLEPDPKYGVMLVAKIAPEAGITARSTLLQIARLGSVESMARMIHEIKRSGLTRDDVRKLKDREKQPNERPKGFLFQCRTRFIF